MKLEVSIRNIYHIKKIDFSVNMVEKSILCITGKNGSGKTTLIKAVRNLISANSFHETSSALSFSNESEIHYKIDDKSVVFKYDKDKKTIDTKDSIPNELRKKIFIELAIPYGERFNFFQKIGEIDSNLRSQIVLQGYSRPEELIGFLESIYSTKKFENLVEILVRNVPYYAIIRDDNYYLREDYFSSGEYFLISLYRRIKSGYMAIFIDEIDISLDAAAQVHLIEWLRKFKDIYGTTFVFTTHSLAMMRMLAPYELFCMEERDDGLIAIENRSYAFIRSTLFGFVGCDRYILTEDEVLKDFIEHLISKYCRQSFYKYKIIYVGGGKNTTDLLERNKNENFFSKNPEDVIVVLDGDQRKMPHSKKDNVYCIPMESVEKELLARCLSGEFLNLKKLEKIVDDCDRLTDFLNGKYTYRGSTLKVLLYKMCFTLKKNTKLRRKLSVAKGEPAKEKDFKLASKRLFKHLIKSKEHTKQEIFDFLIKINSKEIEELRLRIEKFICLER